MSGGLNWAQPENLAFGREAAHAGSFDFVFNAHHEYVYNLANALLRNAQDAEDVTQDVFLRLYKALPSYEPERASMRTWLTRMAVNACQTHRRRNFLRGLWKHVADDGEDTLELVDLSPWGAPEEHALRAEMRRTVKEVLARLRLDHRTVLVLHYYLDLSCAEIAAILECPEGTVYSRLHYARRLVQAQLERRAPKQKPEGAGGEVEL
jgi:RNA polymerase sigma-70 factor, ECF subfamily